MKPIMQAAACAFIVGVAALGVSSAQTAFPANPSPLPRTNAEWTTDVTVIVLAPDGTWGAATEPSIGEAFARAIADCKLKHRHNIGCGYRHTSVRAGWSLALRCGQENVVVAAKTLHAAEQAAIDSEFNLRQRYRPNMPPCVRVLSVDPEGAIIAPDVGRLLRFVMDR